MRCWRNLELDTWNVSAGILDPDDAHTAIVSVWPAVLGLLVASPTKRCQVIQIKAKLREILQRLDVVHICCRSKSFLLETVLAKIVIALERDRTDFAPWSALIKTTFFQGIFFHWFVVHKLSNHARGHRFSGGRQAKQKVARHRQSVKTVNIWPPRALTCSIIIPRITRRVKSGY